MLYSARQELPTSITELAPIYGYDVEEYHAALAGLCERVDALFERPEASDYAWRRIEEVTPAYPSCISLVDFKKMNNGKGYKHGPIVTFHSLLIGGSTHYAMTHVTSTAYPVDRQTALSRGDIVRIDWQRDPDGGLTVPLKRIVQAVENNIRIKTPENRVVAAVDNPNVAIINKMARIASLTRVVDRATIAAIERDAFRVSNEQKATVGIRGHRLITVEPTSEGVTVKRRRLGNAVCSLEWWLGIEGTIPGSSIGAGVARD